MHGLFSRGREDVSFHWDHSSPRTLDADQYQYPLHVIGNNPLNEKIMQDGPQLSGGTKYS
jgi:hypothetical protein